MGAVRAWYTLIVDIHNALNSLNKDTHDTKIKDELLATSDRFDLSPASRVFNLQREWEEFASGDIKVILNWTREFKSSDPRDRVYALTELADSGYGVVPDYSASMNIQSIFLETARKIIAFDRSLDLLTYVEAHGSRRLKSPSWVPEWTPRLEDNAYLLDGRSIITARTFGGKKTYSAFKTRDYSIYFGTLDSPDGEPVSRY